jgi:hypothetical protein
MLSVHYDLSTDTARADALFASALQISDAPSAVQVKQAIDAETITIGDLGCAARPDFDQASAHPGRRC